MVTGKAQSSLLGDILRCNSWYIINLHSAMVLAYPTGYAEVACSYILEKIRGSDTRQSWQVAKRVQNTNFSSKLF